MSDLEMGVRFRNLLSEIKKSKEMIDLLEGNSKTLTAKVEKYKQIVVEVREENIRLKEKVLALKSKLKQRRLTELPVQKSGTIRPLLTKARTYEKSSEAKLNSMAKQTLSIDLKNSKKLMDHRFTKSALNIADINEVGEKNLQKLFPSNNFDKKTIIDKNDRIKTSQIISTNQRNFCADYDKISSVCGSNLGAATSRINSSAENLSFRVTVNSFSKSPRKKVVKINQNSVAAMESDILSARNEDYFKLSEEKQYLQIEITSALQSNMAFIKNLSSRLEDLTPLINPIQLSASCSFLVTGTLEGLIQVSPLVSNDKKTYRGHKKSVMSIAISSKLDFIVSGGQDCSVRIWDLITSECNSLLGHSSCVNEVRLDKDDEFIVSASDDKTLRIWSVTQKAQIAELNHHKLMVWCVALSCDKNYIVSGSADKTIIIWDFTHKSLKRKLVGHAAQVTTVDVSSNANFIVSGSYDKTIKIWNMITGNIENSFEGYASRILKVVFTHNDKYIISESLDRIIGVWSLKLRRPLKELTTKSQVAAFTSIYPETFPAFKAFFLTRLN